MLKVYLEYKDYIQKEIDGYVSDKIEILDASITRAKKDPNFAKELVSVLKL